MLTSTHQIVREAEELNIRHCPIACISESHIEGRLTKAKGMYIVTILWHNSKVYAAAEKKSLLRHSPSKYSVLSMPRLLFSTKLTSYTSCCRIVSGTGRVSSGSAFMAMIGVWPKNRLSNHNAGR